MRALITGATGFLGSRLVGELRARGWTLVCLVRRPVWCADEAIHCVRGDLEREDVGETELAAVAPVDVVFHLAAKMPDPRVADAEAYVRTNGLATLRLLDLAWRLGAQRFVYASSISVIGVPDRVPVTEDQAPGPTNPYALGKLCGEQACELARRTQGRRVTSLRITSLYGVGMPAGTVLPGFVARALASEDLAWYGSGDRTQDFVHVDDVLQACIRATESDESGVYNIGGGCPVRMSDLARMIVALVPGSRSRAVPDGRPDPQEGIRWVVDIGRARRELGYDPQRSLAEGVREYVGAVRDGAAVRRWWGNPCE